MYNTGNPVPSATLEDMADNAQTFDALVTKTEGTTTDRLGITRRVFQQILMDMGFQPLAGSFQTGSTITARNQTLYDEVSHVFYAWGGVIPSGGKVVPSGSTPSTTGGVGIGAWSDKTDLLLRSELTVNGTSIDDLSRINTTSGASKVKTSAGITVQANFDALNTEQYSKYQQISEYANKLTDGVYTGSPETFNIDLYGDSTMWGAVPFATTTQDATHPAIALKLAIDLTFPTNLTTVNNKAISGTTLSRLLDGTDGGVGTFEQRLAASPNTKIVYCNHCLNDCGSYLSDVIVYHNNLVIFVNLVRRYGKVPVLVTPSLISPIVDGRQDQNKRQIDFIETMRNVAKTMSVDLVDNFYYTEKSTQLYSPHAIAPDGVHLSSFFYRQSGYNLAIPLINPHVLRNVGDQAGLATSKFGDSITNARAVWYQQSSKFSSILSGDAISTDQSVNYPVVLDSPTKNTVLQLCGALTEVGGVGQLTYFSETGSNIFDGIIDYKAKAGGTFYDCDFEPRYCQLPAGLSIVGVKINTTISPSPNINFTFSGVRLARRVALGFGFTDLSSFVLDRFVYVRDIVESVGVTSSGNTLVELRSVNEPLVSLVSLKWNATSGAIELTTPAGVSTLWASPSSVFIDFSIVINDNRTVTAKIGGLSVTSAASTNTLPPMFVSNAIQYTIKKV